MVILKDGLTSLPPDTEHIARRRSTTLTEQNAVLSRAGITASVKHLSVGNAFVVTVNAEQSAALSADPAVASVVANAKISVTAPTAAQSAGTTRRAATASAGHSGGQDDPQAICPADPASPLLEPEALSTIHAASSDGSPSAQQLVSGAGVRVGVMAEGLDPDAADYLRADGSSAIVDYQDFSGAPTSEVGHAYGEEIYGDASSIVAQGRVVHDLSQFVNPAHPLPHGCNIRIRGVAPGASLVALKILDSGSSGTYTTTSAMVQAIDYAVSVDHVDVLSESLGAASYPDAGTANAVQTFNDQAIAAGVTVVASSGDAGPSGTIGTPASDPQVISAAGSTTQRLALQVGAIGTTLSNGHWVNGNIASFSSGGVTQSGTAPTLTAPGDEGWAACSPDTTVPGCTSYAPDPSDPTQLAPSSIEAFGGTSQASPFIAGVAALSIQAYRETHRGASPSPQLVRHILTSSADDLGAPADEQGAGQVDALAATRLAMSVDRPSRHAGPSVSGGLLLSTGQINDIGAPGSSTADHVTVTNAGDRVAVLTPDVKQLRPAGPDIDRTVTLAPASDPSIIGPTGVTSTYQKMTFPVGRSTEHLAFSIAYPSNPDIGFNDGSFGVPSSQVTITLLDPKGDYVIGSHPQGGASSSNFGKVEVDHPATGTWTAVLSTAPGLGSIFGAPYSVPAYTGDVHVSIGQDVWKSTGETGPGHVVVPPGASRTLTVHTRLPNSGGDTTAVLSLGPGRPVVPVVQRTLIPVNRDGGTFTGTVTGGNGRAMQAGQTLTYAFDVPAGHKDLDVATQLGQGAQTLAASVILIDPHGQIASSQTNAGVNIQDLAFITGHTVQNYVAAPVAGRWRLVVVIGQPTPGYSVTSQVTGNIGFDGVSVDAGSVPHSARTVLPAGTASTFHVGVNNIGVASLSASLDARTTTMQDVVMGTAPESMPVNEITLLTSPRFEVPPQTTRVSATAASSLPVQAQLDGPTAGILLSGPSAVGPVAPSGGQSTAVVDAGGGYVTPGDWGIHAGSVGPFGADGAPSGPATLTMTARTLGFDSTVTSSTGDPYAPGVLAGAATGTPLVVAPGAAGTVDVSITPTAPVGTVVHGYLDVVTSGNGDLFTKLEYAVPTATGQLVAVVPFSYTVGAAPGSQ